LILEPGLFQHSLTFGDVLRAYEVQSAL